MNLFYIYWFGFAVSCGVIYYVMVTDDYFDKDNVDHLVAGLLVAFIWPLALGFVMTKLFMRLFLKFKEEREKTK